MKLESPNVSIFSRMAEEEDSKDSLSSTFPRFKEHDVPYSSVDGVDAVLSEFLENPKGEHINPKSLPWEQKKEYVEAYRRLRENPDFKKYLKVTVMGYISAVWRYKKREKTRELEEMVHTEIDIKKRVAFAILNHINDIADEKEPQKQDSSQIPNNIKDLVEQLQLPN